ncbi:MAG: aromatic amino acid lyase, partial [Phycisphaerales bacterium]|nr:aromatic amino acid lyase [Phycisphaerales bacterium]
MSSHHPPISLDGRPLEIEDVAAVARGSVEISLSPEARTRMQAARDVIDDITDHDRAVYGINTGFGSLSKVRIPPEQLSELQANIVRSHAAGVGDPLSTDLVRAMMLILAASLARGHSGVRPVLVERLLALLDAGVTPIVPSRGSVGASGD